MTEGLSSASAEVAANCACFNLRKAARAVTQLYDAALAPSGVRATQLSVLVALSLAERAPLSRVAEALVMDRTTLTRNLRPLQRRGWVRIEPGEDRRERTLCLTEDGRAALAAAMPHWQRAQARVLAEIGAARWTDLLTDLHGLISAAREATPAGKDP
jgi:DNA-binding MarR family transcriptional regulator